MSIQEIIIPHQDQRLLIPLLSERSRSSVWAEPVAPGSKLYFASGSLLQTSPYRESVLRSLESYGVLPDSLVPENFWEGIPTFEDIDWGPHNDFRLNAIEEAADFSYQLIKLTIGARNTVNLLVAARRGQNREQEEAIIFDALTSSKMSWVREFVEDENFTVVVESLVAVMDSRSERRADPVVQSLGRIWRKLLTQSSGERMGELGELQLAAYAMEIDGSSNSKGKNLSLAVMLLRTYCEDMEHYIGGQDDTSFYGRVPGLISYLRNILTYLNVPLESVINLAHQKQSLRRAIDVKTRNHFSEESDVDTRAVPKVLTQLCLPYLLAATLSRNTQ